MTILRCGLLAMAASCVLAGSNGVCQSQPAPLGKKVEYKKVDGRSLSLYINSPHGHSTAAVVVLFHGGGWVGGSPQQMNPQSAAIAEHGAVAIEVEYRLLKRGPANSTEPPRICVEDGESAMRWVRAHAAALHIDPDKIAAAGGSAGGYMAAYAAMVPGWDAASDPAGVSPAPNAMVLFNPVLDISPGHYGVTRFGSEAAQHSPLEFVSKSAPPTLILSGSADKIALPESLREFQKRMRAAGVRCDLVFYAGQVHAFFNHPPYTAKTVAEMIKFLASLGYVRDAPVN